ncbi:Uncharacterised protein [Clostridium sporogenes]|nr:Uncharacterised protein [Clostridium sporogenes]
MDIYKSPTDPIKLEINIKLPIQLGINKENKDITVTGARSIMVNWVKDIGYYLFLQ